MVNQEFEGLTINEMADPSCANWVHHVQYVLPQVIKLSLINQLLFSPQHPDENESLDQLYVLLI